MLTRITTTSTSARSLGLHYGNSRRALATVVPDDRWPGMWRVSLPERPLSDMLNLARAKDAAITLTCAASDRDGKRLDRALMRWSTSG
jgi:hypothetical protein